MIPIDAILDAYINANILLILLYGFWCLARMLWKPLGLGHAYTTQLRLFNGVFLAILLSPLFVLLVSWLSQASDLSPQTSINLSEIIVAQYLQGNFEMKPAVLEEYLSTRAHFASELTSLNSTTSIIIASLFAAGIIIFVSKLLISMLALRKIINDSHVWRRFGDLEIRVSDTVSVPFSTRSLSRKYIVIPSNILPDIHNLRMALGHEFQHLRQFDLEWEIALELLKPLFFWNPAFYLWKRQVEKLRELACDQQVLKRKGYDAIDYCECLLHVCQNSLKKNRLLEIAVPKVALVQMDKPVAGQSSIRFLRQRVTSLLEGKSERYPRTTFVAFMLPLLAVVALTALAIQKPSDWSQDRIMLSTIVNLERLAERNSLTANGF